MKSKNGIRVIIDEAHRRFREKGLQPFGRFREALKSLPIDIMTEEYIRETYLDLIDRYKEFMVRELTKGE